MFGSIFYKEYLKSYRVIFLFGLLIVYSLFQTFLDAKNTIEYYEATTSILNITGMGRFDFNGIQIRLVIFGIILASAQFYPEVSQARVRLYLHLPMSHFKLISILIFSGIFVLFITFAITTMVYYLVLTSYYPQEVFEAIYSKLYPAYLMTILCYLATMLVYMEPHIIRKIMYGVIAIAALILYTALTQSGYFISGQINTIMLIIIAIYIITAYEVFSAYTKGYIK